MSSLLEKNNIHVVRVPAGTTSHLQPLDVSVNKPVKDFFRKEFSKWYADKVVEGNSTIVDMRLTIMKPLSAQLMIQFYNYMKKNPNIVQNGFRLVGVNEILTCIHARTHTHTHTHTHIHTHTSTMDRSSTETHSLIQTMVRPSTYVL